MDAGTSAGSAPAVELYTHAKGQPGIALPRHSFFIFTRLSFFVFFSLPWLVAARPCSSRSRFFFQHLLHHLSFSHSSRGED